tara:strand:- start:6882 stop:7175 length:294 start_codon:yes stop_codon:yes gene_type:complete
MARSLLIAAALVLLSSAAVAQNICAPRDDLVKRLWDRWQEAQVSLAMINDGRLLEIFASEAGSWTAIISDPNGRSCVASAGQEWTIFDAPKKPGNGA